MEDKFFRIDLWNKYEPFDGLNKHGWNKHVWWNKYDNDHEINIDHWPWREEGLKKAN